MNKRTTFWKTVNADGYCIVVPVIQRDYVQGRAKTSSHVEDALNKLLSDMRNAIESGAGICDSEKLNLNFIYGQQENKEFPPVDGQQRLTTLFLLHLYAFWRERDKNSAELETLGKKFRYETRETTRIFIQEILEEAKKNNNNKLPEFDFAEAGASIDKYIQDQPWFRFEWRKDPSVTSMLYVFQKFHEKFSMVENLAEILKTTDNINFMLLTGDNIYINDDLYVKLNARGKELSDFENFKADIIKYLEEKKKAQLAEQFSQAIDVKYVDLFWDKDDPDSFNKRFMAFFHWNFFYYYLLAQEVKPDNDELEKRRNKIKYFRLKDYCPEKPVSCDFLDVIKNILKVLAFVNDNRTDLEIMGIFRGVLSFWNEDITYEKIARYYTLYLFASNHNISLPFNDKHKNGWFRILKNLITNSLIDQMVELQTILKSISEIAPQYDDLLTYFAASKDPIKTTSLNRFGDGEKIVSEEQLKASYIVSANKNWKDVILRAEKELPYLNGQIICLFDFSSCDLSKFELYLEKFKQIFDNDGSGVKDVIISKLRRALFTADVEYCLNDDSFVTNGFAPKGRSWRHLLNADNYGKRKVFHDLMDQLDLEKDFEQQLDKIIHDCQFDKSNWRYYFIKEPGVIEYNKAYARFNHYEDNNIILVKNKSANSSSNAEYYTYVLALKMGIDLEKDYITGWINSDIGFRISGINKTVLSIFDEKRNIRRFVIMDDEKEIAVLPFSPDTNILDIDKSIEIIRRVMETSST